jgi:hypothetical protein
MSSHFHKSYGSLKIILLFHDMSVNIKTIIKRYNDWDDAPDCVDKDDLLQRIQRKKASNELFNLYDYVKKYTNLWNFIINKYLIVWCSGKQIAIEHNETCFHCSEGFVNSRNVDIVGKHVTHITCRGKKNIDISNVKCQICSRVIKNQNDVLMTPDDLFIHTKCYKNKIYIMMEETHKCAGCNGTFLNENCNKHRAHVCYGSVFHDICAPKNKPYTYLLFDLQIKRCEICNLYMMKSTQTCHNSCLDCFE